MRPPANRDRSGRWMFDDNSRFRRPPLQVGEQIVQNRLWSLSPGETLPARSQPPGRPGGLSSNSVVHNLAVEAQPVQVCSAPVWTTVVRFDAPRPLASAFVVTSVTTGHVRQVVLLPV